MVNQNHIFVIVYALIILAFGCAFVSVFIYSTSAYYFPCPVASEVFLMSKCIIEENYKRLYVLYCDKDYIVPIIASDESIADVIPRVVSTSECWYKMGINCLSSSAAEDQIVYTRPAEYELYTRYKSCLALKKDYMSVAHILWVPTSMAVLASVVSLLFVIPYLGRKEKESAERIERAKQHAKPLPAKPAGVSPQPPTKKSSPTADKKVSSPYVDKKPRERIIADVRKAKKIINKINNRPADDDIEMHSEPYGMYKNGSATTYMDDVPECSTDSIEV